MKRMYILLFSLFAVQLILAFICGPYSCEWGNTVYFYSGVTILLVAVILPFLQKDRPWPERLIRAILFLLGSVFVWVVGFIAGDFRIMCRMF